MADDTRVVEMQFNNRNFERNISKSQTSLEKFKSALNFDAVSRGFKNFSIGIKDLAFTSLESNIAKLTDKFTGLGSVGEFVLSRIRAGLEGAAMKAEQMIKSLTLEQIKAGEDKYDALTRSVQTIVASGTATEKQAYQVMERVMEYTNQTSHSFETMVGQISALTSTGMGLAKAEKLMEGFANASTKAGAEPGKAAIAMQAYSKALGGYMSKNEFDTLNLTARVVTKEWRDGMIEAGIAAGDLEKDTKGVIKTAKKYGKQVTVTADSLENTLSKKWASKKTLTLFGEKYMFGESMEELRHPEKAADSFGKAAYLTGQRALTFADAMNAVKESISSGWMDTYRILFGDLTDAMNLFTGACNRVIDAISGLSETRNKILNAWKSVGGRDDIIKMLFGEMEDTEGNTLYEGAYGIIDVITDIGNMISEAFWDTFKNLIPESEQRLLLDVVNKKMKKPFESFDELWNSDYFRESGGREGFLGGALQGGIEEVQNFVQGINDWFNYIDPETGLSRMQKIQNVLDAIGRTIAFVVEVGAGIVHFFATLGDEKHLGPSLKAIGDLFSTLGLAITKAENDASNGGKIIGFFDKLAEILQPVCDIINFVVIALTDLISSIVTGEEDAGAFGDGFKKIWTSITTVFNAVMAVAKPFINFFKEVIDILGMLFRNGFDDRSMESAKKRITLAFRKLWKGIKEAVKPVIDEIDKYIQGIWKDVSSKVTGYFNDPNSLGHQILEPLKSIFGPLIDFFKDLFGNLTKTTEDGENDVKEITVFDALGDLLQSAVQSLSKVDLMQVAKILAGAFAIYKVVKTFKKVGEIAGGISDLIQKLQNPLGWLTGGLLGGEEEEESFTDGFKSFATSILMLTGSILLLGNLPLNAALKGVGIIVGLMLAFIGIKKLMEVLKVDDIKMEGFIGFATSITELILGLRPLAYVSWEQFGKMMAGLGAILVELIGFMLLTSYLPISTAQLGSFIGFATSVGALLAVLSLMKNVTWEQFGKMMAGLGGILTELIGFMLITAYAPIGTSQLGSFIGFAVSIGLLIFMLYDFTQLDWVQFAKMMAGLGGILTELIGFMLITAYAPVGTAQMGSFIGFAASIDSLIVVLEKFAYLDWDQFAKMMAGLAGILVELLAFMLITAHTPTGTIQLGSFIGFAASIWLLIEAIKPFAYISWEQYGRVMAGLGGVLVELISFMLITAYAPVGTAQLGSFIGFAASLWLLVTAIKPFADMDWEQYARVMAGLGGTLLLLLGFMAIAQSVTFNKGAIAMAIAVCLSVGVMALLLSVALNTIRDVKWEVILTFATGMAALIFAMTVAITALSMVPMTTGLKGIALITLAIAAIMGTIAIMAPMLIGSIGNSLADLGGKLELIASMLKNFSDKMDSVDENSIDRAGRMFSSLRTALYKLQGVGRYVTDLDDFAYCMFVLGTGVEIFDRHVGSTVTSLDGNAQAALKFIQDLSGCAGDLDTISKMNMEVLTSKISGLGGAMYIFAKGSKEIEGVEIGETPDITGAMRILKALSGAFSQEDGGFEIPENMPSSDEMNLFGASIAALAAGLVLFEEAGAGLGSGTEQALKTLDFFKDLKAKLVETEFIKDLGKAIGVFDANSIKRNQLTEFGHNIEQLGLAMKAFYESVTILDEATGERKPIELDSATNTLDSLIALQGKLGWDFGPIIQFVAGRSKDFSDLADELETLSTALSDFVTKLGGVDENGQVKMDTKVFDDAIKVADKIVNYLNKLKKKMDRVGGVVNIISSVAYGRDYDFVDLKRQMQALADGIESLGQLKVDDKIITVDDTTGIFKMTDTIVAYLRKLRKEEKRVGGIYNIANQVLNGREYDFTDLKDQMVKLGEGLNGLTVFEVKDLPTDQELENIAFPTIDKLLEYLKTIKTKLGEVRGSVGGLKNIVNSVINGREFDFTDLETQLTALGTGLNAISGVNVDSEGKTLYNKDGLGAATETMDGLIAYMLTLGEKIGTVGGLKEFLDTVWTGGDADFTFLGDQLSHIGTGLGDFYTGINKNGDFDAAKVDAAFGAMDHLVDLILTFGVLEERWNAIAAALSQGTAYQISAFHMRDFVSMLWDSLYYMTTDPQGKSGTVVEKLAEFIKEFDVALSELGGLENANSVDILNSLAQSISNLIEAAGKATKDDGTAAVDFSVVGEQMANGIVVGLEAGKSKVITKAVDVAIAAYVAAKEALEVESPSKKFAELGRYVGEGFVLGMTNTEDKVTCASEGLGQDAVDGATNAMAAFTSLMSQDIDANPTITPVLDLTNVKTGSDVINGLLSGEKELSLAGAGSSYSSQSIPRNDGTSGDYRGPDLAGVYAAINGLGNRIEVMGHQISNLKIVMNTGALVGEVTDGINRNLGDKTIYRRRRN